MATNNSINVNTAGTGTVLRGQGVGNAPLFSVATYPDTTTENQILYSNSTNTITGLATANSAVLATNGSGVPSITATPIVTSITLGSGSALSNYTTTASYTPVLSFVGGTTGITYSTQTGSWIRIGNLVFVQIVIVLTNKGSSTGTASITLPVASAKTCLLSVVAGNLTFAGQYLHYQTGNAVFQMVTTASSVVNLTDTAFANNTNLTISGTYIV